MRGFIIFAISVAFVQGVPSDICDQTFEVLAGQTRTLNYFFDAGTYPANTDCVFHVQGVGTEGLRISFTQFDIEKHASCNFDYLQIFDGPSEKSASLAKLCGSAPTAPIETHSNTATLKFVSDRTVHKRGFVLQFQTRSSDQFQGLCQPAFTQPTGAITSPLFPSNYPNRVNCSYEVTPSVGNQILIKFPIFQLERSSYCVMDYVTINTRDKQIGGKLCGDLGGRSYLVPGSHAIINFVSDRSSTRKGFKAFYKIVETCKDLESVCAHGCHPRDDGLMECTCDKGYINSEGETSCKDIDECVTNNHQCQDQCKNTLGSYECACTKKGFFLSPDGHNCTDRTCALGNAGCEHNCHLAGDGGYYCTCNAGFLVTSDGHNCTDIDECTDPKYQHSCGQICKNEPGSYYCECSDGYQLSSNQRSCDDVNECMTQGEFCEHTCHNFPGGWSCACYEGYQVNPSDLSGCLDINECSEDLLPDHCNYCINFDGGYSCSTCESGFLPNDNETICLDVNECSDNNAGCEQECFNTPGSYSCNCYKGQQLDQSSGKCKDINECRPNNGKGPCDHYCENRVGTFQCHCLEGYHLQEATGTLCEDINECILDNGGCSQNCSNNIGSFSCSCFAGYWKTDGQCRDIDECLEYKPCNAEIGAKCVNTEGSYHCICPSGYNVINETCTDIDECANTTFGETHGCPQKCVNTPGSYRCVCHTGFIDIGNNTCIDLNECSQSLCQYPNTCKNTIGSFTCGCPPGYFLLDDGRSCSDVDECASDSVHCDQLCLNEIGTYKCACRDGYELDKNNITCIDVNECQKNISGCSDYCVNTNGGFYCYCAQGKEFVPGNNITCQDTDECAKDNGGCHHICTNTMGSFECGCRDGYSILDNQCHDINECSTNNGGCDQTCNNTMGAYECSCEPDFKLSSDNHTCGHCPTCDMFERVLRDINDMKPNKRMIAQLTEANMQLSAAVSLLRSELEELKRKLSE